MFQQIMSGGGSVTDLGRIEKNWKWYLKIKFLIIYGQRKSIKLKWFDTYFLV